MPEPVSNSYQLAQELRDACNGHPDAKIPWPHRLLHRAADAVERIAELERELAAAQATIAAKDEALKAINNVAPRYIECYAVHHSKKDRHEHDQPCPVVNRYEAALLKIDEALALPSDRTALDAMLAEAEKRGMQWQPIDERCDDAEDKNGNVPGYLCRLSDEATPDGGYPYMVVNGAWLNGLGKEHGITHWAPITPPAIRQAAERSE